ncbi:MAG: FAD-binding oxidoreductase [Pyrinomonadaceae bacterium]|nr:FAD-binding oxidoreductase [Pyrinomonadaceae bacterium]
MLTKTISDEVQSFLADASNLQGGHAARVVFAESVEEVAEILREASVEGTPVTVSGAGTGVVGGRVPFGGIVLATDRLNRIKEIRRDVQGGRAVAEAGVTLSEFQRNVEAEGLLYPPDPTERSCYLGGSVATNASGARTFKYGPTRDYVNRLKIALATGDVLDISRGEIHADASGRLLIPLAGGRRIEARLPSYRMPQTRKHASGYFITRGMDAIDLFIGSEGTLGVITEVEARLLPRPENVLGGVAFFQTEENLLAFVREARARSLRTREGNSETSGIDARALEYFDEESLGFLRARYSQVPERATGGAIFFEQETQTATEDELMSAWLQLLERHKALMDDSWFAVEEKDRARLREFRHQLPVLVNEWLARHGQRKVSTDMAVPDEEFQAILRFYKESLRASNLRYVIFGHVGDNHVHVNIMPKDEDEAHAAREIYLSFVKRAIKSGGTISAEHGIGKLKRDYLRLLYTEDHLREMAALKQSFDPAGILGRGNIFSEEFLEKNSEHRIQESE